MSDVKVCAVALERAAKDIGTEPIVREAVLRLLPPGGHIMLRTLRKSSYDIPRAPGKTKPGAG